MKIVKQSFMSTATYQCSSSFTKTNFMTEKQPSVCVGWYMRVNSRSPVNSVKVCWSMFNSFCVVIRRVKNLDSGARPLW